MAATPEYVRKDLVEHLLGYYGAMLTWSKEDVLSEIKRGIQKNSASKDLVEVKQGYWEKKSFNIFDSEITLGYNCSECNTTWDTNTNYCPNCGAKMDGDRQCENGKP
jgi:hypothetical protein